MSGPLAVGIAQAPSQPERPDYRQSGPSSGRARPEHGGLRAELGPEPAELGPELRRPGSGPSSARARSGALIETEWIIGF
jgi:hypothetical protein